MSLILSVVIALIAVSATWIFYLHQFVYAECKSKKRLDGKTVLITGGNSGIGFETAKDLAKRGARIIITSEDYDDCLRAKDDLISITKNENIVAKYLDFSYLQDVRDFADDILKTEEKIDILINNAGTSGFGTKCSRDGILLGLQINYFATFLLTHLLIDLLKKSAPSRIVNLSSTFSQIHRLKNGKIVVTKDDDDSLDELKIYCLSKLYMLYMTWEMSKKLKQYGITVNCLHPGAVRTRIFKKSLCWKNILGKIFICVSSLFWKTPRQGAQTTIHCAVSEDVEDVTGMYFQDCKPFRPRVKKDNELIKKVWDKSIEVVKLQPEEIKF